MRKLLALICGLMLFAVPAVCYADVAPFPPMWIIPVGLIVAVIAVIIIAVVLIVKLIRKKRK